MGHRRHLVRRVRWSRRRQALDDARRDVLRRASPSPSRCAPVLSRSRRLRPSLDGERDGAGRARARTLVPAPRSVGGRRAARHRRRLGEAARRALSRRCRGCGARCARRRYRDHGAGAVGADHRAACGRAARGERGAKPRLSVRGLRRSRDTPRRNAGATQRSRRPDHGSCAVCGSRSRARRAG